MSSPSNPQGATPVTGAGVVLPANWQAVTASQGRDPQEVDFQRMAYGWGVSSVEVPPSEPRIRRVDATHEIMAGVFCLAVGLTVAILAEASRRGKSNHQPKEVA